MELQVDLIVEGGGAGHVVAREQSVVNLWTRKKNEKAPGAYK